MWSSDFPRGELLVHVEGARPPGSGPFPTVIVHPEEDETATAMHGVIWDLAARGYFAIAMDYQRWLDGKFRRNLFAWRSAADISVPIEVASTYAEVDQDRIGATLDLFQQFGLRKTQPRGLRRTIHWPASPMPERYGCAGANGRWPIGWRRWI